jgi:hypothetical protein
MRMLGRIGVASPQRRQSPNADIAVFSVRRFCVENLSNETVIASSVLAHGLYFFVFWVILCKETATLGVMLIVSKRIAATWGAMTQPKAATSSWNSSRLARQNSNPVAHLRAHWKQQDAKLPSERLRRTQRLRARQAQTPAAPRNARCRLLEASRIALLTLLCLLKINSRLLKKPSGSKFDNCPGR